MPLNFIFLICHRQTPRATKLRFHDFVGRFITHIVAKIYLGQVRLGHHNRSRDLIICDLF